MNRKTLLACFMALIHSTLFLYAEDQKLAVLFVSPTCAACSIAEKWFNNSGNVGRETKVEYLSVDLFENVVLKKAFCDYYHVPDSSSGHTPLIFIGDTFIDGFDPEACKEALTDYNPGNIDKLLFDNGKITQTALDKALLQENLSFLIVLGCGLADGINPCAFVVILFLFAALGRIGKRGISLVLPGVAFALGVFLAYMLLGSGLARALGLLGPFAKLFGLILFPIMGICALALSLVSLFDFFRMLKGNKPLNKLPNKFVAKIHEMIRKAVQADRFIITTYFVCGISVSFVEFLCTGQIYIPAITYMIQNSDSSVSALFLLLAYNLAFIAPLLMVIILLAFGLSITSIRALTENVKVTTYSKLLASLCMASLAIYFGIETFKTFFG